MELYFQSSIRISSTILNLEQPGFTNYKTNFWTNSLVQDLCSPGTQRLIMVHKSQHWPTSLFLISQRLMLILPLNLQLPINWQFLFRSANPNSVRIVFLTCYNIRPSHSSLLYFGSSQWWIEISIIWHAILCEGTCHYRNLLIVP
jgi:hypothetical protein